MARRIPKSRPSLDIFEDEDVATAASALAEVTGRPDKARAEELIQEETASDLTLAGAEEGRGASETNLPESMRPVEPTTASLKFRVRQTTRARFDLFRAEMSAASGGARLTDSHLGRAVVDWFLFEAGDDVLEAARSQILRRPPSDDPVALAAFDDAVKQIVTAGALRWSHRLRPAREESD